MLHFIKRAIVLMVSCACCAAWAQPATSTSVQVPLIIPRPKSVHPGLGHFVLPTAPKWRIRAQTRDERLWQSACRIFGEASGKFEKSAEPSIQLLCERSSATHFPNGTKLPQWAANPEGYKLTVTSEGIAIVASTTQGVFYGLQTLGQLLSPARECPVLEIEDWPSMRFRGAHWFPSASGVPMHRGLIENVFGAFKYNYSIIQCEAARWDTHPEIAARNSVSKPELRKLVELCRSRFIEPVPLINVPGHAEWAFRHGRNLEFAEDPKTPYAYCVNHPKSIQFIHDILGECLPLFEAKYCHLGHDEVTMRGRFPNPECPRCSHTNVTGLVIQHANELSGWLAQQGVETMIWGDMLLGPGEAKDATHAKTVADAQQRRAGISKKVMVTDWHYAYDADDRSLRTLQQSGFRTVAASWYNPKNIHSLSQAALASGAEGLLQTTWAGFFPDETALRSQLEQFSAFVLAAEYAWSGRPERPDQLGYDPKQIFLQYYERANTRPSELKRNN